MQVQYYERDFLLPFDESLVLRKTYTFTLQMDENGKFVGKVCFFGERRESRLRLVNPSEFTLQINVNFAMHPRLLSLRLVVRDSAYRTFLDSAIEDLPNDDPDYDVIVGSYRTPRGIFADVEDKKIIVEFEMDMLQGDRDIPMRSI